MHRSLQQCLFARCLAIHSSATENRKKSLKTFFLKVQGHLRSLILIPLKSTPPVLVTMSSMSVPICNHFHAR